jgi:flagellin-like protein
MERQRMSHGLRPNRWGLSEIVGSLMLVLIVVVAATAFAAFTASYQKQYQAEQSVSQQRNLESLKVLSLGTTFVAGFPTTLQTATFTVGSLSVISSEITELAINGNPLQAYQINPLGALQPGETSGYVHGAQFANVSAREQFTIVANVTNTTIPSSFYIPSIVMTSTSFLKLEIFTLLENDFTRTFVPPTAVITTTPLQIFVGSGYQTNVTLDGSGSLQSANDTLVNWTWTITPPLPAHVVTVWGEKALFPFAASAPAKAYEILLTVTDDAGLTGTESIQYAY